MKVALLVMALAITVAVGCADVAAPVDLVAEASPVPVPTPTPPRTSPSPSYTVTRSTRPPTITVICPEVFTLPHGETARIDFHVQWTRGTADLETWEMTYGDGGSYSADTEEAAIRDVFWHVYEAPGSYTPEVRITARNGDIASDVCRFEFGWSEPPAGPPPVRVQPPSSGWDGGSSGAGFGSGSGWMGCHYNGIPMWGNVKIVDRFADVTVKVVDRFPDLRVKEVDRFPDECGEWKVVDRFPDFTIRFVERFPDITVELVDRFPGR